MAHLSLGVLGPLQVSVDGTPVTTLESQKVRALLSYLAVEADRPHRRDTLVGLLWPDYPEQNARHNLRQALFNLRMALGDHLATIPHLLIARDSIQFNRDSDYSLDLDRFNTIFHTIDKNLSQRSEDNSLRIARLEEMVKLYRGEFLQHFFLEDSAEFEAWTLVQRENSRQRALDALDYLATDYELHGDFQAVCRHALRQLELDPWREEAHCQLMRALALDGQRNAALAQYETCRQVLEEELGVEPSAKTRELYEQIRTGSLKTQDESPSTIPSVPVHNLPVSRTPFLGREQELVDLGRFIASPECRCVTLVGPGGIGKTRLALQTAGQHRDVFADGVVFVSLASVASAEAVIPAIASAIHFSFYGTNDPKVQLLNYLREKQMLLILDNMEHLLEGPHQDPIVELVIEILQDAPKIQLLVTSREALKLQEEWIFEVGGLAIPGNEQTVGFGEYAAVALFNQRARRASSGFELNEANRAGVVRICRLVEGMPLAIELAATWLRALSPAEIAKEIESSLDFLSATLRDLPERHRSMRVVFDHSWQMLSTEEQQVLSQLSVFQGGFNRQAAEQVAGASLSILSTLVNRTLLRRTAAGRYELHELVRQYAAARLSADSQAHTAAQQRHYGFYLALVETAGQELKGRNQLEWLERLEKEHDNLDVALEWALKRDDSTLDGGEPALRLSGALRWFWWMHGHFHEGREWLTRALQAGLQEPTAARAGALLGMSLLMSALGDLASARPPAVESVAIYRQLGDAPGLAEALMIAGRTLIWQGEGSLGSAQLTDSVELYRKAGDRWGEAQALYRLGSFLADYSGDPSGREMLEESAAIMGDLGEKYLLDSFLITLGVVDMGFGDYADARTHFEQGLAVAREIEHPWGVADALTNLGVIYRILGQYAVAQSYLEEAHRVYQARGRSIWETDVLCALAENAISQGDLQTARSHLQEAADLLVTSENRWLQTLLSYFRGLLAYYEGDAEAALRLMDETIQLARAGHYKPDLARALVTLGRVRRSLGELERASELLQEGLDLYRALGHRLGIAAVLEELGAVSAMRGDGAQAVMLLSTADALRELLGSPLPPVDRILYDSVLVASREKLGETAFTEAWARAAARPYQEAVEEILSYQS